MSEIVKPTPTPWKSDSNSIRTKTRGNCIAITYDPDGMDLEQARANAEFIVLACNSYEQLVEALAAVDVFYHRFTEERLTTPEIKFLAKVRAALESAKEK